jgi:hypothetical protein
MAHSTHASETGSTPTATEPPMEYSKEGKYINSKEGGTPPSGREHEAVASKEDGLEAAPSSGSPFNSGFREFFFVGVLCVAQLSTQVSLGQTLNLVHIIGDHFGTKNLGTLSWFVAGYSLTVGSFILLFGRFGDHFGHKKIFIYGLSWFAFWSMVAGVSNYSNYILFIFARVFQGKQSILGEKFSDSNSSVRHWSSHVSP